MATVNFLYRSNRNTAQLTLRLLYRYKEQDYSFECKSKILISKSDWTAIKDRKRIKDAILKNTKYATDRDCAGLENHVLGRFNRCNPSWINKRWLTELIIDYYNPKKKKELPETVLDYFPLFLESKKNKTEQRTQVRYGTAYKVFKRFVEAKDTNPLIQEVDSDFQDEFEEFCKEQDYALSTSNKFIEVIKSLCIEARQNGLILSLRFEQIKLKRQKTPIIYLSFIEIQKITAIKEDTLGARLAKVREWLIISCYTGQRVSDFMGFDAKNIRCVDGVMLLDITQQKTKKNVSIPILPEVQKILDNNKGTFPEAMSEQKFNKYLKEIGALAGITEETYGGILKANPNGRNRKVFGIYPKNELMTSHIGRRSFATNLYGKFSTPLIMNVTGHSKESTFLDYIGKTSGDLAIDLAKKINQSNSN